MDFTADPYAAHLAVYVDALISAGIPATADPQGLHPPGAFVFVSDVEWSALDGTGFPTVGAYLIGGPGGAEPITWLHQRLDVVALILGARDAARTTYTQPGSDPMPAYLFTQSL